MANIFTLLDKDQTGLVSEKDLMLFCLQTGVDYEGTSELFEKLSRATAGRNKRTPGRPIAVGEVIAVLNSRPLVTSCSRGVSFHYTAVCVRSSRQPAFSLYCCMCSQLKKACLELGLTFDCPANEPVGDHAIALYQNAVALQVAEGERAALQAATDAQLRRVFETMDRNADGEVNRIEMIKALRKDAECRELLGLPKKFKQGSQGHTEFETVFQRMDRDGSRAISFAEFRREFEDMRKELLSKPHLALTASESAAPQSSDVGNGVAKLIVVGEPGSGKGAISEKLAKELGLVFVSTSTVYRFARHTADGRKAEACLAAHEPVPDDLTVALVASRLEQADCQTKGFVLDGFPKSQAQVTQLLEKRVTDKVLVVKVKASATKKMRPNHTPNTLWESQAGLTDVGKVIEVQGGEEGSHVDNDVMTLIKAELTALTCG